MYKSAVIVVILATTAAADFNLTYEPNVVQWNEETDISIRIHSNPGLNTRVMGIGFDYDTASDAYQAINPVSFSWTPDAMNDPNQWLTSVGLPSPAAVAFFSSSAVDIPDGVSVEFARLTVYPQGLESLGAWEWYSNITVTSGMIVPDTLKSGDPTTITVTPEPSAIVLLAGACLIAFRRRHDRGTSASCVASLESARVPLLLSSVRAR